MKMYLSVFRIRFINSLQYRAVLLGAVLTRFVWGLMEILAFAALYRGGSADFSMTFSQTVSYIWMQQALYMLFIVVFGDEEIYSAIGSGSIAYELVRPMDLYGRWFCQSAANRIASTALSCLPVLLAAYLLPAPYGMTLPLGMSQLFLFLISTALALLVVVAFAMLLYISLFYTLSHRGIKIIATALTTFLSGGVIPLPFFPRAGSCGGSIASVRRDAEHAASNLCRKYRGDCGRKGGRLSGILARRAFFHRSACHAPGAQESSRAGGIT